MFYQELGLRLNSKTRIYWLDQEKQVKDLLRNLKRVSHGYELPDDDEKYDPKRIIELIISQLEKLKKRSLDPTFDDRSDVDDEILKQIYDDAVSNLLKKDETLLRLKDVFRDFNFDLVAAQPRELIIILLHDPDASVAFEEFLLSKFQLHSRDVNLVMTYLNQTNYQSAVLINKLATSSAMTEVMKVFQINKINSDVPGYFQVSGAQVERIVKFPHVINQAYQRVVCEQRKDYSVALNHLLNEIHAIVYKLADSASTATLNESSFKVNNVIDFLLTKNVPTSTLIQIRNLFDRRNKNPVSHADQLAWPVSRNEYFEYKLHVGACLRKIL